MIYNKSGGDTIIMESNGTKILIRLKYDLK